MSTKNRLGKLIFSIEPNILSPSCNPQWRYGPVVFEICAYSPLLGGEALHNISSVLGKEWLCRVYIPCKREYKSGRWNNGRLCAKELDKLVLRSVGIQLLWVRTFRNMQIRCSFINKSLMKEPGCFLIAAKSSCW